MKASADPNVIQSLRTKLHPCRFPKMSAKMMAIVGHILGETYTNPIIAEMMLNRVEGIVYIRHSDDCGFNLVESYRLLKRNWFDLIDFPGVGLTPDERQLAVDLFDDLPHMKSSHRKLVQNP